MNKVKQLVQWLEGKKSYAIASLTAFDGVYEYFIQHGSNYHTLVTYLLLGGGLAAIRAAIAKS